MFKKNIFKAFNFKIVAFSVLLCIFSILSFRMFYNAAYSGTNGKNSISTFTDKKNLSDNELKENVDTLKADTSSNSANQSGEFIDEKPIEDTEKSVVTTNPNEKKSSSNEITEKSILDAKEFYSINIKYPYFNQPIIDDYILKYINKTIDDFKISSNINSGKKHLNIEYSYNIYSEHIVSIVFKVGRDYDEYKTFNFNIHNGDIIKISDLFLGEYAYIFSGRVKNYFNNVQENKQYILSPNFERYTNENPENYKNFTINDKNIDIYIDKSLVFGDKKGFEKIELDLNSLKDYIKPYVYVEPVVVKEENPPLTTDIEDGLDNLNTEGSKNVRKIDKTKPMIALTFDDGPHPVVTGRILDKLKEYDSRATFFELGSRVDSYGKVTKRISEEGSEIGSHTYDHKQLTKLTVPQIQNEVDSSIDSIKNAADYYVQLVRPPYGSVNDNVKKYVNYPLILWSVDTRDWESKNKDKVIENVLSTVKDGDIILMHDIYTSTADACDVLIPELIKRGYQLVTVSELFENRGYDLTSGSKYREAYKK